MSAFQECFPPLEPRWRPVTETGIRVELFDGLVRLTGRVDLTLGHPAGDLPRKVIIDLKTGLPAGYHRDDLRFYALLETVRMGVPPRALATYYLDAARVEVEEVTPAVLEAALARTIDGTRKLIEVLRAQRAAMVSPGAAVRLVPHSPRLLRGHGVLERADGRGDERDQRHRFVAHQGHRHGQAGRWLDRGDPAAGLHRRLGLAHEVGAEEVDRLVEGGHRERQAPERAPGRRPGRVRAAPPPPAPPRPCGRTPGASSGRRRRASRVRRSGSPRPRSMARDRAVEVGRAHHEVVDDLGADQVGRRQPAQRRRFAVAGRQPVHVGDVLVGRAGQRPSGRCRARSASGWKWRRTWPTWAVWPASTSSPMARHATGSSPMCSSAMVVIGADPTATGAPSCHDRKASTSASSSACFSSGLPTPWPARPSWRSRIGCVVAARRGPLEGGGHLAGVQGVDARVALGRREQHRRVADARLRRGGRASTPSSQANSSATSGSPYSSVHSRAMRNCG